MSIQWSLHLKTTPSARKYGLKLEVVLKWRDIYIENIRIVLLIAGLKMEGTVKWRGLKLQGLMYYSEEKADEVDTYGSAFLMV